LKTIQIPSPVDKKPHNDCVDVCDDDFEICFEAAGTFTPDSNGSYFNPPLVQMAVTQYDLVGPYTAPNRVVDVAWTFTPPGGGAPTDFGTIKVRQDANCRQAARPKCGP
jgi:hypothetical protein